MIKKHISKIIIFSFFFLALFSNIRQISADTSCDPYDCASTNAALRVNNCVYNTSWCGNGSTTPSVPYNCSNDGTPGSCQGWAVGVNGCTGNTPIPSSSGCSCSIPGYDSQCVVNDQGCGPSSPYGGTCSDCVTTYSCGNPVGGYRSCCLVTANPYCGDGTCNNGETNCTCPLAQGGDCGGTCGNPPPGPYCGDNICNNGETNCTCGDCSGTCPPPGGNNPSCTVSLSPSSVNLYTDSNPFNITANVSNIQDGSVSQVEFSKSNNNISMNPVFDQNGTPYQSYISPQTEGTTTLTANVYFNGEPDPICSTAATVNVALNTSPVDEAPDCSDFTTTDSSVTAGENVTFEVEITDIGTNYAFDGGFESGDMNFWPTAYQLDEWWAVPNATWPSAGSEGGYYAKIKASLTATDPHSATGWLETGENLTGQNYTLKLKSKSHSSNETVGNVFLQREPYNGDWAAGVAPGSYLSMALNTSWQDFTASGTWANPGNGSTTSRFRVVLRPGSTHGGVWTQPIYYDSIKAYKTNTAGVAYSTIEAASSVKFHYILTSANHCVAGNWTEIPGNITKVGDYYSVSLDTSGMPAGNYDITVNASDIVSPSNNATGNVIVGNPSGGCYNPSYWTARPACVISQEIVACNISCTEDCGTGVTLGAIPTAPTNFTVDGLTSGNIDLTTDANLTFAWTASTIQSPATINQYEVRIWDYDLGATPPATCDGTTTTDCVAYVVNSPTVSTIRAVNSVHTNHVRTAVRAINNTCPPNDNSNWSTVREFNLVAQVSGNIYDAVVNPSLNNCAMPNPVPSLLNIAATGTNIVASTGGTTANPTDTYTLSNIPYAPSAAWDGYGFNVTLSIVNSDPENSFYCSCPGQVPAGNPFVCQHTDTRSPWTIANGNPQNFFVTTVDLSNSPWWQASEGNVYSAQGFTSNVPDSALTYLITQNAAGNDRSAGIPLSGGTITAGVGRWTEYNGGSIQPRAYNTTHTNVVREDYDFFVRNVDLNAVASLNASITTLPNPTTGTLIDDARVFKRTGDLALNLSALQTVTGGTKMVIFVSGNVTISNTGALNRHMIDIDSNSYLAIIAGGNITFSNTIGNTCAYPTCTATSANIDGVYIASGQLIIDDNNLNPHTTPDNMFVGEGTFVGWGGIDLQRTFDNTTNGLDRALNNTYATEVFTFRPDFNENTPEILRRANLVWQEVN